MTEITTYEEWLKARLSGIGASEAAAVIGRSQLARQIAELSKYSA